MIGVELVKDPEKTSAQKEAKIVKRVARELGVLVGRGGIYGNIIRDTAPASNITGTSREP